MFRSALTVFQQGEVGQALLGSQPCRQSCTRAVTTATTARVPRSPRTTPTTADSQADRVLGG